MSNKEVPVVWLVANRIQRPHAGVMTIVNSHIQSGELDLGNMPIYLGRLIVPAVAVPFIIEMVAVIEAREAAVRGLPDPLCQNL